MEWRAPADFCFFDTPGSVIGMSLSDLTPGVQSVYSRGLCPACHWSRLVVSGRGSQFLLCNKAFEDPRFPKYPPQPIASCGGFTPPEGPAAKVGEPAPGAN